MLRRLITYNPAVDSNWPGMQDVPLKQRLLYLQSESVSIRSPIIAMALHEPVAGSVTQIAPTGIEWPYSTVHDAVVDGWRVVSFPSPKEPPVTGDDMTLLGYEFILEKMEQFDE